MWKLLLLLFSYALSQPVIEDGSTRVPRELIECCPCPSRFDSDSSQVGRASSVDDCPCRSRSADSEGASSILFPSTVRSNQPFVRPIDPKEEQKNILEPEVGLATSVLETLREVTEEEYQDALARDAARAAAGLDAAPEETARNVVIIVNPRDDDDELESEASHTHESHFTHPLETPSLGSFRDALKVPDVLRMPRLRGTIHRDLDSDVGASNVEEKFTGPESSKFQGLFRHKTPFHDRQSDSGFNSDEVTKSKINSPLLNLKLTPIPKLKLPNHLVKTNDDLNPSPSELKELADSEDKKPGLFRLAKRPTLRNLLKLKDVELVPKSVPNSSRNLNLESPLRTLPRTHKKESEDDCIFDNIENGNMKFDGKSNVNDGAQSFEEIKPDTDTETSQKDVKNMEDPSQSASELSPLTDKTQNEDFNSFEKSSDGDDDDCDSDAQVDQNFTSKSNEEASNEQVVPEVFDEQHGNTEDEESGKSFEDIEDTDDSLNDTKQNTDITADSVIDSSNHSPVAINQIRNIDSDENSCVEDETLREANNSDSPSTTKTTGLPITKNKRPLPLSDALTNIRENVKKTLEKLKIPPIKKLEDNTKDHVIEPSENNALEINSNSREAENQKKPNSITEQPLSLNDLQKLSDNILNASTRSEEVNRGCDFKSIDQESSDKDEGDNESAERDVDVDESSKETESKSNEIEKIKTCPSDVIENVKQEKSNTRAESEDIEVNSKEMNVEASEPAVKVLHLLDPLGLKDKLSTPLIPNFRPQPKSTADPLNLFGKPLDEVLNLKPTLPTLDGLKEQFSNIFGTDDRSAVSEEFDYDEDVNEKMLPEASIKKFQKNVPSLGQDFNVDIFKLKPLKSSEPDALNLPTLNLNSFRAKLPIPTNLDLKPLKLESSIRNKDGILGASLNFQKKNGARKLGSKKFNIFKGTLPSIDDLRDALGLSRSGLGNPLKPDLSFLQDTLPITDLTDNIRRNAEKTRKGIEKKMKTALRGQKINEPLAKPQELLEDVGDKLKAIHYDLNDRITTLHENLFETAKTKPMPSLRLNSGGSRNVKPRLNKAKTIRLQSAASSTSTQSIEPRSDFASDDSLRSQSHHTSNFGKPTKSSRMEADASDATPVRVEMPRLISPFKNSPFSHAPSFKQVSDDSIQDDSLTLPSVPRRPNFDNIRRPASASTPRVEMPRLMPPLKNLPFSHAPSFKQVSDDSIEDDRFTLPSIPRRPNLDIRRPVFKKPAFRENKVTISFGTTTAVPIMKEMTTTTAPFKLRRPEIKETSLKKHLSDKRKLFPHKTDDFSNSETKLGRNNDIEQRQGILKLNRPEIDNKLKSNFDKPVLTEPRLGNKLEHFRPKHIKEISRAKDLNADNKFLNKVRDAVRERLASLDHLKSHKETKPLKTKALDRNVKLDSNGDMARSASVNKEVVISEPLKENVSYKCRLMCTRE